MDLYFVIVNINSPFVITTWVNLLGIIMWLNILGIVVHGAHLWKLQHHQSFKNQNRVAFINFAYVGLMFRNHV